MIVGDSLFEIELMIEKLRLEVRLKTHHGTAPHHSVMKSYK